MCFCCLKIGHGSKDCDKKCVKCDKKHHVAIHEEPSGQTSDKPFSKTSTATDAVTLSTSNGMRDATLGALPVHVRYNGKEKLVVALVDSGSNTTLGKRSIVDELGITGDQASPVAVHTMNEPSTR